MKENSYETNTTHIDGILIITIVVVLVFVVLFETDILVSGLLAGDNQTEFLFTTMMELVTLGFIFLSLRMFKFGVIRADLIARKEIALRKWGVARMILIQSPLWFNTLLYYFYMKPTFGYLAIISALCLPFLYPTMSRCVAETSEEA